MVRGGYGKRVFRLPAASALLFLALAGCAAPISAPPLEKRAVEAQPVLLPEGAREPAAPVDPAIQARLDAIEGQAADDHRRFGEARQATTRVVRAAAGLAPGAEGWTAAQQAVSALESTRGPLRAAQQAVEQLRVDPVAAGSGSRAAIEATAARIAQMDGEEAAAVAALAAALR
jgi:predicted small lipoprotein YifL